MEDSSKPGQFIFDMQMIFVPSTSTKKYARRTFTGKIVCASVCGYCPLPSCTIGLIHSSQKRGIAHYKSISNCDYMEKFNIKSAKTCTKSMLYTHWPVNCPKPGCSVVVWSHNLYEHFKYNHTRNEYDDTHSIAEREILGIQVMKHCSFT